MKPDDIRVLIIDDSPIVHTLLEKVLPAHGDVRIIGDAFDGRGGVAMAKSLAPDVIIMDIHMPGMSGLEAIEEIMAEKPTPIIVFSSASKSIVDLSFKAIERGAVDLVEKPAAADLTALKQIIEEKLLRTVRTFADFVVMRRFRKHRRPAFLRPAPPAREREAEGRPPAPPPVRAPLAPAGFGDFFVVAIAASTGGPQMLRLLLEPPGWSAARAGVIVLQHLADGFVEGFADWLRGCVSLPVSVARLGEPVAPGVIQVAPGGHHLGIDGRGRFIAVDAPPMFGIRPSADILFDRLAEPLGNKLVACVLSGMGSDGAAGLKKVKAHGGYIVAQDEESSLIFGMPKSAIDTGTVDRVLGIREMPEFLIRHCGGEAAAHAS